MPGIHYTNQFSYWDFSPSLRLRAFALKSIFILILPCLLQGSKAATLQVPTNFVVQLAASEPNIQFPMFACLDDRGALLVAESSGLDLYKEISAGTRKCQVRKLQDRDGDGAYETASVFADKLVFPM